MKTWMVNLLMVNIHTSLVNTGASLGTETLKFYIWMQKIVFFVMLTMTLKAKTLTMKTWMVNLLMVNIHTSLVYIWLEMTLLLVMMTYGNNLPLIFITFPLRQSHCLGLNRKRSWTAFTTLVLHTLELRINRCNSNSRRPLVPFQLRK
jgi:hypothetical protein